jgi:hypothetical protein
MNYFNKFNSILTGSLAGSILFFSGNEIHRLYQGKFEDHDMWPTQYRYVKKHFMYNFLNNGLVYGALLGFLANYFEKPLASFVFPMFYTSLPKQIE